MTVATAIRRSRRAGKAPLGYATQTTMNTPSAIHAATRPALYAAEPCDSASVTGAIAKPSISSIAG
jgi:hypothetical protein